MRQMMVALHPFHVQILHAECTHLALVRECIGDFVKVILTAVSDVFLQPGYKLSLIHISEPTRLE